MNRGRRQFTSWESQRSCHIQGCQTLLLRTEACAVQTCGDLHARTDEWVGEAFSEGTLSAPSPGRAHECESPLNSLFVCLPLSSISLAALPSCRGLFSECM